ncbi:MAG: STAS domain-containing protein, partial [Acidimicrobiales bacterium]
MATLRQSFEDSPLPSPARYPWFAVESSASDTGAPVIVVHGEVDRVSAPELTDVLDDVLKGIPNRLIFDLSNVKSLGLAGVRIIDDAAQALPAQSAIVLRHPQPRVRRVLELTHTDDF